MQQFINLRINPVCAGLGIVRLGRLVWEFETRPTPFSRLYRLRLVYRQGGTPKILVVEPDLSALARGRKLPHVYEQRPARLCVYLPGAKEWERHMRISETIVPWAILWLFYFEEWLASNEWQGGGVHPRERRERH